MRWATGQVILMRAGDGALEVEISVPDDADIDRFAQVVKYHLERFGLRDELNVVWSARDIAAHAHEREHATIRG